MSVFTGFGELALHVGLHGIHGLLDPERGESVDPSYFGDPQFTRLWDKATRAIEDLEVYIAAEAEAEAAPDPYAEYEDDVPRRPKDPYGEGENAWQNWA